MIRFRSLAIAVAMSVSGLAAAGWIMTGPNPLSQDDLPEHVADPENGRRMFLIGGCASCHASKDAQNGERLVLLGGQEFTTDFGTFVAPNISPNPESGIGNWSDLEFVNAVKRGISPDGGHYYPAFPYGSYVRMRTSDVLDLWSYIQTLPMSDHVPAQQQLAFPFSIRRGVGFWKQLYMDSDWVLKTADDNKIGRYLVEGPGHCAECHTSRTLMGGLKQSRWMAGAPNPEGRGRVPNITPGGKDTSNWSVEDIAEYLKSGFTPEYDTAGGSMVSVIENTSRLSDADRSAIARYIKALPAHPE